MATIAQGQQAGILANGLVALQTFANALQAAINAGQSVNTVSVACGLTNISFAAPISVSDSAVLLNALISLAGQLSAEWTNQLNAL